MVILKNQTVYKCEHCGRRFLSRSGIKKHEPECRKNPQSPRNPENCQHEQTTTVWDESFVGDAYLPEPAYDLCLNCGTRL